MADTNNITAIFNAFNRVQDSKERLFDKIKEECSNKDTKTVFDTVKAYAKERTGKLAHWKAYDLFRQLQSLALRAENNGIAWKSLTTYEIKQALKAIKKAEQKAAQEANAAPADETEEVQAPSSAPEQEQTPEQAIDQAGDILMTLISSGNVNLVEDLLITLDAVIRQHDNDTALMQAEG